MTSPPASSPSQRLSSTAVRGILEAEGLPVICGPHGFDLPCVRGHGLTSGKLTYARIERGSGIAGRGYHWHIVDPMLGTSPSVTTRKGLRRLRVNATDVMWLLYWVYLPVGIIVQLMQKIVEIDDK